MFIRTMDCLATEGGVMVHPRPMIEIRCICFSLFDLRYQTSTRLVVFQFNDHVKFCRAAGAQVLPPRMSRRKMREKNQCRVPASLSLARGCPAMIDVSAEVRVNLTRDRREVTQTKAHTIQPPSTRRLRGHADRRQSQTMQL